jgi:hypothetical protein
MESKPGTGFGSALKKILVGATSACVLLISRLRRNRTAWFAFRLLLGFAGAELVLAPVGLRNNWLWAAFGVAMFAAAVLLPGARRVPLPDKKATELGAPVVDGGELQGKRSEAEEKRKGRAAGA